MLKNNNFNLIISLFIITLSVTYNNDIDTKTILSQKSFRFKH